VNIIGKRRILFQSNIIPNFSHDKGEFTTGDIPVLIVSRKKDSIFPLAKGLPMGFIAIVPAILIIRKRTIEKGILDA
jgi:hypothetical protein